MQKAVVLAMAPSVIAASLSDEQLSVMQGFVRSPAFAKLANLLRGAVKAGTAFTKADILEAKKSFEDLESKAKGQERNSAEERKIEAEWDALAEKWTEILKKRISPEVRDGLDKGFKAWRISRTKAPRFERGACFKSPLTLSPLPEGRGGRDPRRSGQSIPSPCRQWLRKLRPLPPLPLGRGLG